MSLPRNERCKCRDGLGIEHVGIPCMKPAPKPPGRREGTILDRGRSAQYDRRGAISCSIVRMAPDERGRHAGVSPKGKIGLDVLSDVLRAVRLTGAIYFDVHACHPWVAETPPISSIGANVMPDFEHVIAFHLMLDGWCWAQLADESQPPIRLENGRRRYLRAWRCRISCPPSPESDLRPNMEIYYRPKDRATAVRAE